MMTTFSIDKQVDRLPPIHPGEILDAEFLRPLGIGRQRLAEDIGLDAAEVAALVNGEIAIAGETAQLLGRFFGNSPAFWLGLQNQYDREMAADRLADRPEQAAAFGG